jgi:hypothetical protein
MADVGLDTLVLFVAVFAFSIACAMLRKGQGFSTNIFLGSFAIGITVLVWMPIIPTYMIVLPILILVGMMFSEKFTGSDSTE